MIPVVSLKAVVEVMDLPSDELHTYLNRRTGELVTIGEEEIDIIESGETIDDYPEWQQEAIRKTQEVLVSVEYLALPSKFDIHEYAIMERFCLSRDDLKLRDKLLHYVRRSGAFRRFKNAIHECGIVEDWYHFRGAVLEQIAIEWLESNHIPYTSDNK